MLKILSAFCILAGSTGTGLCLARELEQRIRELLELQQLMLRLRGEIRYAHEPLPEAFLHLGMGNRGTFAEFFLKTAEDLQERKGRTAEQIWQENLSNIFSGLHLSSREKEDLVRLGGSLGSLDVEMQLNMLDYYLEQLRNSIEQAAETSRSRRKLYQYLGILSGLMLVILVI